MNLMVSFNAITIALTVIIGALQQQSKLLVGFFYQAWN